jgi:hypothetical protein
MAYLSKWPESFVGKFVNIFAKLVMPIIITASHNIGVLCNLFFSGGISPWIAYGLRVGKGRR